MQTPGRRFASQRVRSRTDLYLDSGNTLRIFSGDIDMIIAEKPNFVILPGVLTDEALFRHQARTLGDIAESCVAEN